MIAPHTIIGSRYRVVRALGGGGMKLVYLAEDLRLAARKCALAEMVDTFTSVEAQQQAVSAFQREADMLAQLNNEHIPRVFDRFSEGNHHFLVMEYIDGSTLEEQIKQHGGKLAPEVVVEVALQVLDTLDYLHHLQPPVIYRDLKPSNIMVTGDGQAKLIDFGIARHFQPLANATMIGTQGYAPPEQYRGKVETRSDIYALGATMHHALSGRDPAAEAPFSFPPLHQLCPDVDARLAGTIDQALAYDVANRLAGADEFRNRLFQIKGDGARDNSNGRAPSNSLRTQLPLPLGHAAASYANASLGSQPSAGPAMVPGAGNGPTVLTAEITCSQCMRLIPADSHFCSYCAADLRLFSAQPHAATASDETVVLSSSHLADNQRNANPGTYPPPSPPFGPHRRHRFRHPLLMLALIGAAFMVAVALIKSMSGTGDTPPAYSTGSGEGTAAMPPAHAAIPPGEYSGYGDYGSGFERARLTELREELDAQGYSAVKFRLDGATLVLYGSVPTEYDRAAVQAICFATTGLLSLSDDLTVSDTDPDD